MADKKTLWKWNFSGFLIIVILGFLFHFIYDWTNRSILIGAFVPVNESVWEHLKLGLWGVIIFSFIEYKFLGSAVSNYFLAKAIGVLVLSLTILLIYYTYSSFTDKSILAIDITSYIVGVLFCQILTYKIYQTAHSKILNLLALLFIVFTCIIFAIFTYYPPHEEIFKDARYNTYGIDKNRTDSAKK